MLLNICIATLLIYMKVVDAGITVLVILYGYVMLAPHAWIAVLIFLALSCFFHTVFYLQVHYPSS